MSRHEPGLNQALTEKTYQSRTNTDEEHMRYLNRFPGAHGVPAVKRFFVAACMAAAFPAAAAEQAHVPKRDPFTASNTMHALVGRQSADAASSGRGFVVGGGEQIPRMKLRGFVNNKQSVAVLDIEGVGTYLVRKDDEIGLQAIGRNTVIRIIDVDGMGVKVQPGSFPQVIVVR